MRINHNLMALNANRYLSSTGARQQRSLEKVSSGLRINSASDDAAGLAISEKMRAQISGLDQAESNAQDGISLIQTAEGALSETHSILQRMRELAVQSANDTNTTSERAEMQKEVDELAKEITRISNNTEFNSQKLVNGGMETGNIGALKFHIGANAGQDISLSLNAMDAESLGVARDDTTATGTVAGDIASASFSGTLGAGVVNGSVVTATYTAADPASAAAWNTGAVTEVGDNSSGTFIFNGVTITVNTVAAGSEVAAKADSATAASVSITNGGGANETAAAIIAAANTFKADVGTASDALDDFTFGGDGSGITIVDTASNGATNNDLTITGTIGITEAAATTDGEDAVSAKVTLSGVADGETTTQDIDVTASDTTLEVTEGNFKGMTLTMNTGKTVADMATGDADTVTLAVTGTVAAAATFTDGALSSEAIATAGIDVSSQSAASNAITVIDDAITTVSGERSKLGAYQNRLEHTITSLTTTSENVQASESRIRDVDIAKEMMNYTKLNILQQAAQSMLAQANQAPQGVLKLLG